MAVATAETFSGRLPVGAVADHRVGTVDRDVGERQAVDVDAERQEVGRDQPRAQAGTRKGRRRIDVVEAAIGGSGRVDGPVGRPEPLHTAALLVNQNRHLVAADAGTGFADQPDHLLRGLDITLEEDQAPGGGVAQKSPLFRRQGRTGQAGNEGTRHGRGLDRARRKGQAARG